MGFFKEEVVTRVESQSTDTAISFSSRENSTFKIFFLNNFLKIFYIFLPQKKYTYKYDYIFFQMHALF